MSVRGAAGLAAVTVSLLGLAACSGGGAGYGAGGGAAGGSSAPPSSSGASKAGSAALQIKSSKYGNIVVDGHNMTVYVYDKDTPNSGKSSCTGPCAAYWPEVTTTSKSPHVMGVTGKVGTIKGVDGKTQVTLNGWPLYTFVKDRDSKDVYGQGFGGIWWVVGTNGTKITKTPATKSTGKSSSSSNGGY